MIGLANYDEDRRRTRRIQILLDTLLDLDPDAWFGGGRIPKTKIGARCPRCGAAYRSARWIAERRAQRHARAEHKERIGLKEIRSYTQAQANVKA